MDNYFIISNSDGDTMVERVNKDELTRRINEQYYGEVDYMQNWTDDDTNYWGDSILIIKGDVIVPIEYYRSTYENSHSTNNI